MLSLPSVKNLKIISGRSRISFLLCIFFIAITFTSCKSFDTKFRSDQDTLLYATRQNSIFSYGDTVHFYLNGQKIGELEGDTYFALHIKPGRYSVNWKVYSGSGELLADLDYGSAVFKAGVAYGCAVNHAGFAWRKPFDNYDVDIQGAMRRGVNLAEEIDLRDKIKPLK